MGNRQIDAYHIARNVINGLSYVSELVNSPDELCSMATSAPKRDISEKATLSRSRSASRFSARVFICKEVRLNKCPSDMSLTAAMVSLAAISS